MNSGMQIWPRLVYTNQKGDGEVTLNVALLLVPERLSETADLLRLFHRTISIVAPLKPQHIKP